MDLWRVLVLAVLKQGLGCDFDRLHDMANHHGKIREFLGHGDFADRTRYEYQTVVDNVSLLTPELLSAVGRLVVESGHKVAKKSLASRCADGVIRFVVETDVHYPTDVNLLWDAMRRLLRETGRATVQESVGGWRQWLHLTREVRNLFNRVRSTRRAKHHPGAGVGVSGALSRPGRTGGENARCAARQERRGKHSSGARRLPRSRPAPDGPCGAAACAGRNDSSRGEGLFDLRRAHALDFQKEGGHAGGIRGACRPHRGPVSVHPAPSDPVGGGGRERGGADG